MQRLTLAALALIASLTSAVQIDAAVNAAINAEAALDAENPMGGVVCIPIGEG